MITPKTPKQTHADEVDARELVNLRDGGVCVKCGRVDPLFGVNFDHRKNRSQGGLWSASNGQLMCGSGTVGCHGWATQHPAEAVAEGWAVPSWADPLVWPARRWLKSSFGTVRLAWVLYRNTPGPDGQLWDEISDGEAVRRMEGTVR